MDVKEADKVVIVKPVASRPACSSFRSFSDLLAGAINASPSNESSEATVPAIRPRTMRFKPPVNHSVVGFVSSQADLSGAAVHAPFDKVFQPDKKSNVVFKPMAKLVSRRTTSVLTNMQDASLFNNQESAEVEAVQQPNLVKRQTGLRSELHQNFPSPEDKDKDKRSEYSTISSEIREEDHSRSSSHTATGDRPSYDGYNWRKYGQKQVKGSEFPRSYYKCTHPNCPVRKKIERSLNGEIAEIVYKGEHNHPKPPPLKRNSDEQLQGNRGIESNQPLWCNQQQRENEHREATTGNLNASGFFAHSSNSGRVEPFFDDEVRTTNFGASPLYNSNSQGQEFEEGTKMLEAESDELMGKRRKYDHQYPEAGTSTERRKESLVVVQNAIDSTVIRDGFRWRKYGQKVVKGNPYPRSYYRCTNVKCNVRKYVERTSEEPNAFITTYEGKHNHEMPTKNTNSAAAKTVGS